MYVRLRQKQDEISKRHDGAIEKSLELSSGHDEAEFWNG